jgi:Cu/Ag efflux protein CusF
MLQRIGLFLMVLALVGCGAKSEPKRYAMKGVVTAVDASSKTATIDAGKIEGWMEAMAMEYSVKPDAEFAKLHPGDHIEATVVVTGDTFYVTDVKVLPKQ